jgi:pimeloyl-ACP methyl ester carboxylesterase
VDGETMIHERSITLSSGLVSYRETDGRGKVVLLIHGNSFSNTVFDQQMNGELGKKHHIIAPDLPGHGRSDNSNVPHTTYTIPGYADIITELLGQLGLDRVILMGWSLGGHIAIEMTASALEIEGLVISGTPPIATGPKEMSRVFKQTPVSDLLARPEFTEADALLFMQSAVGRRTSNQAFLETILRTDGRARQRLIEHWLEADQRYSQHQRLENYSNPIAVIQGENEPLFDNGYLSCVAWNNLWEDKIHILSEAGHAPFLEYPASFNAIFDRFITGCA